MDSDSELGAGEGRLLQGQLDEGIALAREGDHAGAREIFRRIIHSAPDNEDAWLWLAWIAESREQTLRYLREAEALLPDSTRITEAVRWAREQAGEPEPEPRETPVRPAPRMKKAMAVAKGTLSQVDRVAQAAQENATKAFEDLRERASTVHLPQEKGPRDILVSIISVIALAAIFTLVYLGVTSGRDTPQVVQALELPTPVANPTSTPTAKQRAQPLWTTVEIAWTRQDWDSVIQALERIRAIDPRDQEARQRLAEAHFSRGLACIDENDLTMAGISFDAAIRLDASSETLQEARDDLQFYQSGLDAYQQQDWTRCVDVLRSVYEDAPRFRDTQEMLARCYYNGGEELIQKDLLDEALSAFQTASALKPDWQDPKIKAVEVHNLIEPPRRIEVDLSDKMVTVYENNEPIRVFQACTGRPSAPTVPGRYKIQTKMDMAYASKWDLNMPNWLGIYDAGGSENGFHALPILSNGATLWRGSLGTGCSYGCIVLDTPDAVWLYEWADLGVVVFVRR